MVNCYCLHVFLSGFLGCLILIGSHKSSRKYRSVRHSNKYSSRQTFQFESNFRDPPLEILEETSKRISPSCRYRCQHFVFIFHRYSEPLLNLLLSANGLLKFCHQLDINVKTDTMVLKLMKFVNIVVAEYFLFY